MEIVCPYCNDSQNHENKTKMEVAPCQGHLGLIRGSMWHHVIRPCGNISFVHIIFSELIKLSHNFFHILKIKKPLS